MFLSAPGSFAKLHTYRNGIIIPSKTEASQKIEFGIWLDAAPMLSHTLLAGLVFLLWDRKHTTLTPLRWADAMRFYPFLAMIASEKIESITKVMGWLRNSLSEMRSLRYRLLSLP
jgi:hypothetical protein